MTKVPYTEPTPAMARALLRWQMRVTDELPDDAKARLAEYASRNVVLSRAPGPPPEFVEPLVDMLCTDAGLAYVRALKGDLFEFGHKRAAAEQDALNRYYEECRSFLESVSGLNSVARGHGHTYLRSGQAFALSEPRPVIRQTFAGRLQLAEDMLSAGLIDNGAALDVLVYGASGQAERIPGESLTAELARMQREYTAITLGEVKAPEGAG